MAQIYAHVLSESAHVVREAMAEIGVKVSSKEATMDARPLLRIVLRRFFGGGGGLVGMLARHVVSPLEGNARLVER